MIHDADYALLHGIRPTNGVTVLECRPDHEIPENRILCGERREGPAKDAYRRGRYPIKKLPTEDDKNDQTHQYS